LDLNLEYADHQRALMQAGQATNEGDRVTQLARAAFIAGRISGFQQRLGAAAACAWSMAQVVAPVRISAGTTGA